MKKSQSYQTKNKERILEYILARRDVSFNANDAYRHFINNDSPISLSTIYRQLDKMAEEGLLQKYRTSESDTAFYYYAGEKRDDRRQPLMKCTSCGQTFPLKCHTVEQMAYHIWDQHHFLIELDQTTLFGKCARCTGPDKNNQNK